MDPIMIKRILSLYPGLRGEYDLLRSLSFRGDEDIPPRLKQRVSIIEAWLRLLTDEEWFVVTRHLMDQLTWVMVLREYEKRWGEEHTRDERTLKRTQARALQKIEACVARHNLAQEIIGLFS